jgi:hypothetical protein
VLGFLNPIEPLEYGIGSCSKSLSGLRAVEIEMLLPVVPINVDEKLIDPVHKHGMGHIFARDITKLGGVRDFLELLKLGLGKGADKHFKFCGVAAL